MAKTKIKYYSLAKILETKSQYNVIVGERSNGKTYAILEYALSQYFKDGSELAIIRRWDVDFQGKNGSKFFDNLIENGVIKRLSNNKYTGVNYYSQRWYFTYTNDKGETKREKDPFAYAISLTSEEHIKSTSYPKVKIIFFDEFLTRNYYLPDEFVKFQGILSTIIRLRTDVIIFMAGNTVNKFAPYWGEMGLNKVKDQQQGTIDVYTYGDSGLQVAVEYCNDFEKQKKPSNIYFAFNNPKLNMIKKGTWEIDLYPHCPCKYLPKDILYIFFIEFDGNTLQCEIVDKNNNPFIFIHMKTTPLKDTDNDLIYTIKENYKANYNTYIGNPRNKLEQFIYKMFVSNKVFYQDNETGELVRNYINESKNK